MTVGRFLDNNQVAQVIKAQNNRRTRPSCWACSYPPSSSSHSPKSEPGCDQSKHFRAASTLLMLFSTGHDFPADARHMLMIPGQCIQVRDILPRRQPCPMDQSGAAHVACKDVCTLPPVAGYLWEARHTPDPMLHGVWRIRQVSWGRCA